MAAELLRRGKFLFLGSLARKPRSPHAITPENNAKTTNLLTPPKCVRRPLEDKARCKWHGIFSRLSALPTNLSPELLEACVEKKSRKA